MDVFLASYLIDSSFKPKNNDGLLQKYGCTNIKDLENILMEKLKDIHALDIFTKIEVPLSNILKNMSKIGILIDKEKLNDILLEQNNIVQIAQNDALKIANKEINLNSPKQLQTFLFDELKLPVIRKIKTGFSTDNLSLMKILSKTKNEFVEKLLIYRESVKQTQIIKGLLDSVQKDNRIRTTFIQNGTSTGRLASANPNLQNIPIKNDVGSLIRKCFIANKNNVLISADYSQIELRIVAHMSMDETLISAFKQDIDLHKFLASKLYDMPIEQVTSNIRNSVKALVYGLLYGMSAHSLSIDLNISQKEADKLYSDFFGRFSKIKEFFDKTIKFAKKNGYTETILGRRRYFADINYSNNFLLRFQSERMELTAPIQGSAADIIKIAMVNLYNPLKKLGANMLLQIHDELIVETPQSAQDQVIETIKNKMSNAYELKVPLKIAVGIGNNWNSASH
jgi:DNA polymerase-1